MYYNFVLWLRIFFCSCDVHRPKSYPAQLESTLRLKDTRRKESRMRKEERKEARKKKLKEEVSEGRALKMKEHQEKMKKIMEVAGLDDLPFQVNKQFIPHLFPHKQFIPHLLYRMNKFMTVLHFSIS